MFEDAQAELMQRLERRLAALALACAAIGALVWAYAGGSALLQGSARAAEPRETLGVGDLGDPPRAVRAQHWTIGKHASGLRRIAAYDVPTGPESLALLPDGRLLVCCFLSQVAAILDPSAGKTVSQIPLGGSPACAALTREGARAWVTLPEENKIVVVDLQAGKLIAEAACGGSPEAIAASPDESVVLVANWETGDVTALDGGNAEPIGTIAVGTNPRGIAFHPTKPFAYVSLTGGGALVKLNWRQLRVEDAIEVTGGPRHLVSSPDGETLYLARNHPGEVAKVDRDDGALRSTCFLAKGRARTILLAHNGSDLFAANSDQGWVTLLNAETMSETASVEADVTPDGMALSADGRRLYVANRGTGVVIEYEVTYGEAGATRAEAEPEAASS